MRRWSRIIDWITGRVTADGPTPTRRERREAARRRHHATGRPLWTGADVQLFPGPEREVSDLAPMQPGYRGPNRTIRDD